MKFQVKTPQGMDNFAELNFKFSGLAGINKYWKDMQVICLNTRLGLQRGKRNNDDKLDDNEKVLKSARPTKAIMSLKDIQVRSPCFL